MLLASEEWAAKRALPVQAYLTYSQTSANNFVEGEGLLMAPTIAVSRMLERAQLKLQDFDFYEIHEAFAAQVLATLKALEDPVYCKTYLGRDAPLGSIDRAKLNVKGSSLAFGHPFAATGARIVGNLAKLLGRARRARADLRVHGRRHGRRRHHGEPQGRRDAHGGVGRHRANEAQSGRSRRASLDYCYEIMYQNIMAMQKRRLCPLARWSRLSLALQHHKPQI